MPERIHKIPVRAILALGSNLDGRHGGPAAELDFAIARLRAADIQVVAVSRFFKTTPIGRSGRQPDFTNSVALVKTSHSPSALLRIAKRIEREAGRRLGRRWGPRNLDIDLIDVAGLILPQCRPAAAGTRRSVPRLILPHERVHLRAFALIPLRDVAPHWRHPRLHVPLSVLIARLRPADRRAVVPVRACVR